MLALTPVSVPAQTKTSLEGRPLSVAVRPRDGSYAISTRDLARPVLLAGVAAKIDHRWVRSSAYPLHNVTESAFKGELGPGRQLTVIHSGLPGSADLICTLRLYDGLRFGDVEVSVRNSTGKGLTVQAVRSVEAMGQSPLDLGGADAADRVLSDSFSEDRPELKIYDLAQAPGGAHRGVGSQLIYNRQSGQSLFLGALTSRRFLTILRLQVDKTPAGEPRVSSYAVESTGTTEIMRGESLREAPPEDQIELSLPLAAGESISSERLMFASGSDYHADLDSYGEAVRLLHHARVSAPSPIGWWSWTAYYFGLAEATALTNARWLSEHLRALGYEYFHLDEGYQYARGEYTTPDAAQFPHGMLPLSREVARSGLKLGVWTAPFEVSARSWVYENHRDWLVHNGQGKPIQIGYVSEHVEPIYVLDATHPGAQNYLTQTYKTLVNEWGVRYIKLDFMDDCAIEGDRYRPHTTALEAQRIGLKVIREAVGEDVLLDKDGSPMLNPVGYVDTGRVSVDTGHSFLASKAAAPGIAARYYMNRRFFINDPDAFSVSRQVIPDRSWHNAKQPLTLDEAEVAITLAALSGGMFELGDDLPTLGADPDRLALVENRELLKMARLSQAAVPLDLMTFRSEDEQPSLFLLQESPRQAVLALFNWTEQVRSHQLTLSRLKLVAGGRYRASDVFDPDKLVSIRGGSISLANQPPHSVRLIKLINTSVAAVPPSVVAEVPGEAGVAQPVAMSARTTAYHDPVVAYRWSFGDGTTAEGAATTHSYTRTGRYTVRLAAEGVDGLSAVKTFSIVISGTIDTRFHPNRNRRFAPGDLQVARP